jgi:lysosomal acid lipase/cholesteryl ester hydrolase
MDVNVPQWFDPDRFPPLSIFYGGRDYLVLTEPLLERIREKEKGVKVIRVERLGMSEVSATGL